MNVHEYQAKAILAEFGVPVPRGIAAFSAEEAVSAAKQLGGPIWVARAQIHAGGRGKGGAQDKIEAMKASGIRVADSPAALGTTLVATLGG